MVSSKEPLAVTKAAATVNQLAALTQREVVAKFATKIANNFVHFVAVLPPLVAAHSSSHL